MVSDVRILVIRTKILNTINYSILIILSCLFETRTWSAYTQNQTPDGRTAAISNAANCGEAFVVLVLCLWRRRLKLKWNLFLKLKYHRRQECEWRFFTASTGLVYTGLYISHKVWQSWTCIGWGLHVWLAVVKMIDSCNCHHHHQIIIIFIGGGAGGGAERQLSPHLQTRGKRYQMPPFRRLSGMMPANTAKT